MTKIISWNINSVRLRIDLVKEFVEKNNPDILCLQETKTENQSFPLEKIKNLGFDFVEFDGEKSYNGVAILSKIPLTKIEKIDVENYGQKRHLKACFETKVGEIELHNFYVPAGGDVADVDLNPKFKHKIEFVDFMHNYFAKKNGEKIIILGDFNIAPLPSDVWSHKQLLSVVSHTPIETEKFINLQKNCGFIDCHRKFINESEKLYSWWSYRGANPMKSNRGRRLDHILASKNLSDKIQNAKIHIDFRIKKQPSDHVPVETTFSF